jgi:hypothetical protein
MRAGSFLTRSVSSSELQDLEDIFEGKQVQILVPMETSTSTGNCQGDSRSVKGGVGNKKTSSFSKAITNLKNKCPHTAQPTGVRASMQAIGKT